MLSYLWQDARIKLKDQKTYNALGFMSGTSLDGVDGAFLCTDGKTYIERKGHHFLPFSMEVQHLLKNCLQDFVRQGFSCLEEQASHMLTDLHVQVAQELIKMSPKSHIDLIGFHGQTVLHMPDKGVTKQIGNPAHLQKIFQVPVVFDFRKKDILQGGQGAPLVPIYHWALARPLQKPVVFINIGGVSNLTWIGQGDPDQALLAFDCGPGNALLNDWMWKKTGIPLDKGGQVAAQGKICQNAVKGFLSNDFFQKPPPKSLDRYDFVRPFDDLSVEDGAATLTFCTALSLQKALDFLPEIPQTFYVCGGGRHNHTLMKMLNQCLPSPVLAVESLGLQGDFLEAEAFAYLAVRCIKKWPFSYPATTGVRHPMTGGEVI